MFALPGDDLTTATAWIGVLAYTSQIYFDFSGYSDMALGLGRMFGFQLPENFARPYSSESITDFWRRWHMSLSRWFRDYVYIPLGGNRGTPSSTYRNLIIVFTLTGLWHGAAWTFLIWGLYHGALLIIERVTGTSTAAAGTVAVRRALTLLLVMFGWVLFRAPSLSRAGEIFKAMVVPSGFDVADAVDIALTNQRTLTLILASLVVLLPPAFVMGRSLDTSETPRGTVARFTVSAVTAPVAAVLLAAGTFSPFLYFQF
jgi:alginate O-acetyltransferase complex protein AlgI